MEEAQLRRIVEGLLEGSELFLVDLRVQEEDRIFVEVDRMDGISIDDCVELNQKLRELLDEEGANFEVNVASPGLDEPFKVAPQYRKNIGQEVSVLTRSGQRINGLLEEVDDSGIRIKTSKKERVKGKKKKELVEREHHFAFEQLKETKAVVAIK